MAVITLRRKSRARSATVEPRGLGHYLAFLVLVLGALVVMAPFAWLILTSLKPENEVLNLNPIPSHFTFQNYKDAFTLVPFLTFTRNSLFIAIIHMAGVVTTSSLVGYGFARIRFWGREPLFIFVLSTMMLPGAVTLVPVFIIWRNFNLIDTYWPLIVPAWLGGGPFYIFLMRQFFRTIPGELEESARIDGASTLRIWWQIMMPLSKPAVTTIAIFSFMESWNDFIGPLIYLSDTSLFTLPLGLNQFVSQHGTEWGPLMAASAMVAFPMIVLFLVAQRYFVQGIVLTGLKG